MNELVTQPPFDRLWSGIDPYDWLDAVDGETFREVDGRRTFRFEVEGKCYFAKVHGGVSLRETLKSAASLRRPEVDSRAEVLAIEALHRAGTGVPKVAAWGVRGERPRTRRSFIITEDVGTQRTLNDLCRMTPPIDPRSKRILIGALARATARMHGAGVNHRDCYLVHVLCPPPGPPFDSTDPALVFLDLHRAQVRPTVPLRWRAKDLGGLYFTSEPAHLTRTDRARFIAAYAGTSFKEAIKAGAALWRRVEKRRDALERERARRGGRFGR